MPISKVFDFNKRGWKRGAEDHYPNTMDSSLLWNATDNTYDPATGGDLMSGMVVTVTDGNKIARANGGRFRGTLFSEASADLNESLNAAAPAVIVGEALIKVLNKSLNQTATFAPGDFLTTTNGRLTPVARDATTGAITTAENAIVGSVQEVHGNGIKFRQFTPTI